MVIVFVVTMQSRDHFTCVIQARLALKTSVVVRSPKLNRNKMEFELSVLKSISEFSMNESYLVTDRVMSL